MGFLSSLKGLFSVQDEPVNVEPIEYKGFQILIEPRKTGGQFGVGARMLRTIDGEQREHRFIRADMLPSAEACTEVTLNKAKMTIDQLGDRIFTS
jgi:hypothetical protein